MTWNDVIAAIREMSADQRLDNATVRTGPDEFMPVIEMGVSCKGDSAYGILDEGHRYLDVFGGAA